MSLIIFSFSYCFMILGMLVSILGTCLCTSHSVVWSFLILGTLSSSGWLKSLIPIESVVQYFAVSVLGSLIFLASASLSFSSSITLQIALLLKLGLAPFHFWVFKVLRSLSIPSLCFFLGPIKFGLLYLFTAINSPSLALSSVSLLFGTYMLWVTSSLGLILYASGSCQLLIFVLVGPGLLPHYFLIYCLALSGLYFFSIHKLSALFALLRLGALPPLSIFWAKALVLCCLPFTRSVLVLLISLTSLWPYVQLAIGLPSFGVSSPTLVVVLTSIPFFLFSMLT